MKTTEKRAPGAPRYHPRDIRRAKTQFRAPLGCVDGYKVQCFIDDQYVMDSLWVDRDLAIAHCDLLHKQSNGAYPNWWVSHVALVNLDGKYHVISLPQVVVQTEPISLEEIAKTRRGGPPKRRRY